MPRSRSFSSACLPCSAASSCPRLRSAGLMAFSRSSAGADGAPDGGLGAGPPSPPRVAAVTRPLLSGCSASPPTGSEAPEGPSPSPCLQEGRPPEPSLPPGPLRGLSAPRSRGCAAEPTRPSRVPASFLRVGARDWGGPRDQTMVPPVVARPERGVRGSSSRCQFLKQRPV